ncbi:hypothetical protein ACLIN3_27520 (plasmid) [Pseudomonas orientalis]|uniref:hypothetical protein n=1 Tax=Pseudomonas orientalis TaxID=76758 RepID=UPI0039885017
MMLPRLNRSASGLTNNRKRICTDKPAQPRALAVQGRGFRGLYTKELHMTDKQINVPTESIGTVLNMIEKRIHEIGKTYQDNGRSYQDDLEISFLRAMARQLGFDFEVSSVSSGFAVTRHEYTEAV